VDGWTGRFDRYWDCGPSVEGHEHIFTSAIGSAWHNGKGLHAYTKHKFLSMNFRGKDSLKISRKTDASPPTDMSLMVPFAPLYELAPLIRTRFPINRLLGLSLMALESTW
jgi:hypothetical protein